MRIVVRLVLYPMALGLIVLAWREYHGGSSSPGPVAHSDRWEGATSQRYPMMAVSAKGALGFFETTVMERCSDGSLFRSHWSPIRHQFVQDGDTVRSREPSAGQDTDGEPYTSVARVWAQMDGNPRGTIRIQVRLTRHHRSVTCDSGAVTFALKRAPIGPIPPLPS